MRLLIASVAAFAAVAFAAPSFAQEAAAPTPAPSTKPKPGCAKAFGNRPTTVNPHRCQRATARSFVLTTKLNCIAW